MSRSRGQDQGQGSIGALCLFMLALTSCAGSPPRVKFGGEITSRHASEYAAIRERLTRQIHLTHDYDTAIDARVTLISPEFRAAYLNKVATMRALAAPERDKLAAEQREEDQKYLDFILVAQTGRWDWNDLASPRSIWTITLTDDQGRGSSSPSIQPAPFKPEVLAELFPEVTPFTRTWRVRYPREISGGAPLASATTRFIMLRIAGPLGNEAVRWDAIE